MSIRYCVGLDLGDAESALAVCTPGSYSAPAVSSGQPVPTVLRVGREAGRRRSIRIGVEALTGDNGDSVRVNFKNPPSPDDPYWTSDYGTDLLRFAEEFTRRELGDRPWDRDNTQLVVGCPAVWPAEAADEYERLLRSSEILPRHVIVVPESRSAFVQFWLTERGQRDRLLDGRVVVIDIGSSTVDVTTIDSGQVSEDSASRQLGLFDVDEGLLEELADDYGDDLRLKLGESSSRKELALYLCRMRKEQEFGRFPDPDVLHSLTRDGWASYAWELLQGISVSGRLGDAADPGSWLGRFRSLVAELASRTASQEPLVIVTGGGAAIPELVEVVSAEFRGCHVQAAADPALAVAKGLSEYGRLQVNANGFITDVMALLRDPPYRQRITGLYPGFRDDLARFFARHLVDGVWTPIFTLWGQGELRMAERGNLEEYAWSLFRTWLRGDGAQTYGQLMDDFNGRLNAIVNDAIAEVTERFPIKVLPFAVDLRLPILELFQLDSAGSQVASHLGWSFNGLVFRFLDHVPVQMRQRYHRTIREQAFQEELKSATVKLNDYLIRYRPIPDGFSGQLDQYVTAGVRDALDNSLAKIHLLLLKAHRDIA